MKTNQNFSRPLDLNLRLKTAHLRIIHQSHDSETLIIDLDTGHYFCLEGIAPLIWEAASGGTPMGQIARIIEQPLASPIPDDLVDIVFDFISELVSENLLAEDNETPRISTLESAPLRQALDEPMRFQSPKLSKFTDLAELLLADPIHEIDTMV